MDQASLRLVHAWEWVTARGPLGCFSRLYQIRKGFFHTCHKCSIFFCIVFEKVRIARRAKLGGEVRVQNLESHCHPFVPFEESTPLSTLKHSSLSGVELAEVDCRSSHGPLYGLLQGLHGDPLKVRGWGSHPAGGLCLSVSTSTPHLDCSFTWCARAGFLSMAWGSTDVITVVPLPLARLTALRLFIQTLPLVTCPDTQMLPTWKRFTTLHTTRDVSQVTRDVGTFHMVAHTHLAGKLCTWSTVVIRVAVVANFMITVMLPAAWTMTLRGFGAARYWWEQHLYPTVASKLIKTCHQTWGTVVTMTWLHALM